MTNNKPMNANPPCRVKWTLAELRAAKLRQQAVVDALAKLRRDLTPRERASLMLALRTIRQITKVQAQRRAVLPGKKGH